MSDPIYTFDEAAVKRIAAAVFSTEFRRISGAEYRKRGYAETHPRIWTGIITDLLDDGQYVVERAHLSDGVVVKYAEDEPQYLRITAKHIEYFYPEGQTNVFGKALDEQSVVTVIEWMDSEEDDFVTSRTFWFSGSSYPTSVAKIIDVGLTSGGAGKGWNYVIKLGSLDAKGVFVASEKTAYARNTFEIGNTSNTLTGGDGVIVPPVIGTLTRTYIPVGSIVVATKTAGGLYAFTATNPYIATC